MIFIRLDDEESLVDLGFRSGGKKFFIEVLPMECSEVMRTTGAYIGWGPGPALAPWKLLGFTLPNMHSPCF